jgi:hypothetical protein
MTSTARELCIAYEVRLSSEGGQLLSDRVAPLQFVEQLLAESLLADARRVLAHTLPSRHSLWWGHVCARDAYHGDPPPSVAVALTAVARFVANPSDENRRDTTLVAEIGAPSIVGCLTAAAFFSEGSAGPAGLPHVAVPSFVTPRLVGVAVYLASVRNDPGQYREQLRRFLEIGLDLAHRPDPWSKDDAVARSISQPIAPALTLGSVVPTPGASA